MEFARTSGLSECKRLRSSESRWPRLRAVVGPRPKAARHPAGEPENGRQLPGVKRIFRHPSSMCWSRWNIHLPSTTYLSIDLSTYPTTYLPKSIYPSIYLSLASRGIDCSRPCPLRPGRPWSHGTAGPRPFHWTPKALAWKARPSMASFGLRLAFSAAAYSDFPPRWRESRVPHKKHSGRSSGGDSFCRRFAGVRLASCSVNPNRTLCAGTRPLAYRGSSCATHGEPLYTVYGGLFLLV